MILVKSKVYLIFHFFLFFLFSKFFVPSHCPTFSLPVNLIAFGHKVFFVPGSFIFLPPSIDSVSFESPPIS